MAVIADFNTDKQKSDLFEKVNSGEVRVVIGSTTKLGTGVNIQERLAVAHHIDCPFPPSDVEQRDGRIIRQGNVLEEVEIIRYGIEQTLDAGMYAILERKQKFINDAMKGRCARTIQEINDDCALDYASFSAAITIPKTNQSSRITSRSWAAAKLTEIWKFRMAAMIPRKSSGSARKTMV
ncbi:MAG: helicase C-terminal domain-containing protein [Victivallaceae bacterium]|nr:helicase C-terminal domain-containing protein [Victivallaceae bacterium]